MAPWENEEFSHRASSRLFPCEAAEGSGKKPTRRIVLAELPDHERDRFFEFLVANKVEFVAEPGGREYSATIRVVKPPAPGGSAHGAVAGVSEKAKARRRPLSRAARQGPLPQTVRNKEVMKRKSCTLGLLPSSWVALGTATTRGLTVKYHAFLKLAPPLVLEPKQLTASQLLRFADETYARAKALPARAPTPPSDGKKPAHEAYLLPRSFRQCLLEVISSLLGLPQLVGQCCWGIIGSVEALRRESIALEMFGRFLDDTYDHNDFAFFLLIRSAVMRVHRVRDGKGDKAPGARKDDKTAASKPTPATSAEKPPLQLSLRQCVAVLNSAIGKRKEDLKAVIATRLDHELGEHPGQETLDGDVLLYVAVEEFHLARDLPPPQSPEPTMPMLTDGKLAEQVIDAVLTSLEKRGLDLRELFTELNVNETVPMSPEQMRVLLQEGGLGFSDAEYAALISRVDREGRGEVTPEQMMRCLHKVRRRYQRRAFNEAKVRTVESGEEGEADLISASKFLPPNVLERADDLASSLRKSLAQMGESEVDHDSAFQWALQAVLHSREMAAEAGNGVSPGESFFGENAIGDMPVEDMEKEWAAWIADSKGPPKRVTLLRQAWTEKDEDDEPNTPSEPRRQKLSLIQMPPEVFEQDIEGNVKALLEHSTDHLAQRASKTTSNDASVRQILAEQLAPTVDGMMEALVVDSYPRWLQLLGIPEPGNEQNRTYFEALRRAFIEVLSNDIDGPRVQRICEAVVDTPELQSIAFDRARIIDASTSWACARNVRQVGPRGEHVAVDRSSPKSSPRQGALVFTPFSQLSIGRPGGAGEALQSANSVEDDVGHDWDHEVY